MSLLPKLLSSHDQVILALLIHLISLEIWALLGYLALLLQ
jgi:hypothetical protein